MTSNPMHTPDAKVYIYSNPRVRRPEIPSRYKDKIAFKEGVSSNRCEVYLEQPARYKVKKGDTLVYDTIGIVYLGLYECYAWEYKLTEKRLIRKPGSYCYIDIGKFRGNPATVATNVFYQLSPFVELKDSEYETNQDVRGAVYIKGEHKLRWKTPEKTFDLPAVSIVISSDQMYDIISKYLTFLRRTTPEILETSDGVELRLTKKRGGFRHLQLAVEVATKILDTPDETDEFLPKIDFSMGSCLLFFDFPTCVNALASEINKFYEENTSRFVQGNVSELKSGEDTYSYHYIAKIKDGICEVALPTSYTHKLHPGESVSVFCITKSIPQI